MTSALDDVLTEIGHLLGARLSTSMAVREQHGTGEAYHETMPPDAVAFAHSVEEVQTIARICNAHGVPLIPYGAGTSLEGHVNAVRGGIALDLSEMNKVRDLNQEDLDCICEPGVTREALNSYLRDTGLFFSVDPGAEATIGGMAATRASGTNTVRYGTIRDNILALKVVLANGEVITTGCRARKSSAGYDLTRLFVGSEGTLGIIVELTLRLHGRPEAISSAICSFETLEDAVNSVIPIIQLGIPIAKIELLDDIQVAACNRYSGTDYPPKPTLFFEFHGSPSAVEEQSASVRDIALDCGGYDFHWATEVEARTRLWQARYDAFYASKNLIKGASVWSTDVCVPVSQLADCIAETRRDIEEADILAPILGHVGDGNFHVFFVLNPKDSAAHAKAKAVNEKLMARALSVQGTCTGEHGIGMGKIAVLEKELGAEAVNTMKVIKAALDPKGILNPGKIFSS